MEPTLQKLTGEKLHEKTAILADEARLDISARGFWETGQMAFFDIRVFYSNAKRYSNQSLNKCYESNEKEKKRKYNERIIGIEHGCFTPLVLSANGGMGRECKKFYSRLSEHIAEKRKQPQNIIASWIRRKISFSLMRSVVLCVRGSRSLYNEVNDASLNDAEASEIISVIK